MEISGPPVTPSAASIRDFLDRNTISVTTLASTYKPNSYPPPKPVIPGITNFNYTNSPSTPQSDSSSLSISPSRLFSEASVSQSSITDISIHLEENDKTPTKARTSKLNENTSVLSEHLLSSNGHYGAKRRRISSGFGTWKQEESHSQSFLLLEKLDKLSDSAQEMPSHPAYDVSSASNRKILDMFHQSNNQAEAEPAFIEVLSHKSIEKTNMDLDVPFDDSNKENIDPKSINVETSPLSDYDFLPNIPRREADSAIHLDNSNQEDAEDRQLQIFKTPIANFTNSDLIFNPIANSTPEGGSKLSLNWETPGSAWNDGKIYFQNMGDLSLPEVSTGLKSKLGCMASQVQFEKRRCQQDFNLSDPSHAWQPKIPQDMSFKSGHSASSDGIPATPMDQKLIHKNAKDAASRRTSLRNMKKLEELKLRFPRNLYLNGKKSKDYETLLNPNYGEFDWSEDDVMSIDRDGCSEPSSDDVGCSIFTRTN